MKGKSFKTKKTTMEEPFLRQDEQLVPGKATWQSGQLYVELKKVSRLAAPMATVTVAQYLLPVISVMVAGHNGELQLSGVALATSFTNVSGFSIMFGLVGALETLCGQAYGAKQYEKIGTYTYAAIASNVPICVLISVLWIYIEKLLISLGQDPDISRVAGSYALWLIPALFAHAIVIPLTRFLLAQGLVLPLLYTTLTTLLFHIPVCWALVFGFGLESNGAAMAIGVSFWFYAVMLSCYVRFSSSCKKTRGFISEDFVSCVKQFFQYGVPSAAMTCLEWWLFELLILCSGLLPNPKLETSVLSICLTTASLHYVIPAGVAAAVSTRVSNKLGAGIPQVARVSVLAGLCLWLVESALFTTLLFTFRNIIGYAFSNSKEVVDYVAELSPLLCLSFILDSFTAVLNGVARGSGWQHIGALNNVVAYYLVGAPVGIYLAFSRELNGKGLWCGVVVGSAVQAIILTIVTASINWKEQAEKARKRIVSAENGLA
ncbi:PREDICTED: protein DETOXIFICATION 3 [Camelina sativa]|uniref:Protein DETOXIFICATION n=1 Tax=Camelina sativa TaxID=90675 RepID=A0ABM0XNT9_CAMSA|nr:PREDICTED: protein DETOXIFICATION 3 [Camelina sativa]